MIASGLKCMCNFCKSIFVVPAQHKKFLFVVVLLLLFYTCSGKSVKNNQFDYFVFSQRWLPSACIEFLEYNSSSSAPAHCVLPKNYEIWAIHGLWPTQSRKIGPFFCNRSLPFDVKTLQPIESDLNSNWPNIEGGQDVTSLWKHEWEKHGTCAAQLESLNSEIKYFSATLNLFKTYNIQNYMMKSNYFPILKNGVTVSDLFYIVKNMFGRLPEIHCINVMKSNTYLSEIRLCFNKYLELMDCGMIYKTKVYKNEELLEALTNCPTSGKIMLPFKIDVQIDNNADNNALFQKSKKVNHYDTYDTLIDILRIIWFLQWASI